MQLTSCHLEEIQVKAIGKEPTADTGGKVRIDYTAMVATNEPRLHRLIMKYAVKPPKDGAGYVISAQIEGQFLFPEGVDPQKMAWTVRLNGCSILYGVLRGVLSGITGGMKHGQSILPTVNFVEVVKSIEEKRTRRRLAQAKREATVEQK